MTASLVSCIVPVYNAERFLDECIQSILNQTYTNFELILINDGSTDRSEAIMRQYRDPRIRVITQRNSGIVRALNRGLSVAAGDFIARMDADDISLPNRFEIQAGILEARRDVVLVGGRFITIDATGVIDGEPKGAERHARRTKTDFNTFPPRVATALHPLIMMRASAIKAIGGYREGYPHAEDYDMYMRISKIGKIENIDDVVLKYRLHGANISVTKTCVQERAAVQAELDNMNAHLRRSERQELKISQRSLDGYVELRVFRRELGLGIRNYRRLLNAIRFIVAGARTTNVRASARLLAMWIYNNARYMRNAWI